MRKRKWWFIGLALVSVVAGGCAGGSPGQGAVAPTPRPRDAEPFLFAQKIPSCREWAEAANFYIALGESAGLARLKADMAKHNKPFDTADRAAHLCRVLFESKDRKPLRQPNLGVPGMPYETMPLSAWPEFPMVIQDGVWFILSEGYDIAGYQEPLDHYVAYCQAKGRYRTTPMKLPTTVEATAAINALLSSSRWKAIKWSHNRDEVVEVLREQARSSGSL